MIRYVDNITPEEASSETPLSAEVDEAVKRIEQMESILTKLNYLNAEIENKIDQLLQYQSEVAKLESYYTSPEWKKDYELDEKGKLPSELKRGVLSEDGIYNALERNKKIACFLIELKNYNIEDR